MTRPVAAGNREESQAFSSAPPSATCPCQQPHRQLHAGVFFDGTNNNKDRDLPLKKHTNVARLWKLYREFSDAEAIHKKKYVDGVGSMDTGARRSQAAAEIRRDIRWYNPLSLLTATNASAGRLAADLGANVAGMVGGLGGKERLNRAYFWLNDRCGEVPAPAMKTVDVYGFSRGAALARTFVNLVNMALRQSQPQLSVRFVGVFDTVGSFGIAGDESDPGQNMYIDATDARRIEHHTARHEHRYNFPLTVITGVDKEYAGVHSDVGGSYPPKDEDNRYNHLVYIPLTDMYAAGATIPIPMDPLAGEIEDGLDVEALRALADLHAGPNPPANVDRARAEERNNFFRDYVHESHASPSRWWLLAGPIGAAIYFKHPNRSDTNDIRRKFTPRRYGLKGMPPGFDWNE